MRRKVVPSPLKAEAFAPFGDVIEARDNGSSLIINDGYAERFHDLACVDTSSQGGRTLINIFRSTPLPSPILIRKMECHPLGSQGFMPIQAFPYLVVVAPAGMFDSGHIRVFRAEGHQGVNYHRGVWHHFVLPLGHRCDFLVIDRGGPGENFQEIELPENDVIEIESPCREVAGTEPGRFEHR